MSEVVFDLPEFLERVQDDKELLLELIKIFSADFKAKIIRLQSAVKTKDFEEIKSISHSLKGASGNISAKSLHGTLCVFEQKGKENDPEGLEDLLKELENKFEELEKRVEGLEQELG